MHLNLSSRGWEVAGWHRPGEGGEKEGPPGARLELDVGKGCSV